MSDWSKKDREAFYYESMERWHRNRPRPMNTAPPDAEMVKAVGLALLVTYLLVCAVVLVVAWLS